MPKLFPKSTTVSNEPTLLVRLSLGVHHVSRTPRIRDTLAASGELSNATTSNPFCCRYRETLPARTTYIDDSAPHIPHRLSL